MMNRCISLAIRIRARMRRPSAKAKEERCEHLMESARLALEEGRYEAALPLYEAWCNKMPADLSGHIGLGICLLSLSRAEECVRRMETVRATLPEHELVLGLLARAYAALRNADALLDAWQQWNACVGDRATAEFFAQTVHMWGLLGGELSASQGADAMLQRLIYQPDATVAADAVPALCNAMFHFHEYDRPVFLQRMAHIRRFCGLHGIDGRRCKAAAVLVLTFDLVDDAQRRLLLRQYLAVFEVYSHWAFVLIGSAFNEIWDAALRQTVKNVGIVGGLLAESTVHFGQCRPETLYRYFLLASVCNPPVRGALAEEVERRPPEALGAVRADLVRLMTAHRNSNAPHDQSTMRPTRRLKIAVCVSGQLRGFQQSFQSWRHLGLHDHAPTFFVHTWRDTGAGAPVPPKDERCLPPAFSRAYRHAWQQHGAAVMRERYPAFFSLWKGGSEEARVDELAAFYGTPHVWVDDERDEAFRRMSNAEKMYYKIERCNEAVKALGEQFDLVVRLRPDMLFTGNAKLDWSFIYQNCHMNDVLYSEHYSRYLFPNIGYAMPDQFAIARPEVMDSYANAYRMTQDNHTRKVFEHFPTRCLAHRNVAYSTLYGAVDVVAMPLACTLVSTYRPSPADVVAALLQDAMGRMDETDLQLLNVAREMH